MLSTGTIELVVSGIWDSNYYLYLTLTNRMDKSIEDFNKAIELDG